MQHPTVTRSASEEFFKGYPFDAPLDFPDIGSVVVHTLGSDCRELPGYIFCPGINMPIGATNKDGGEVVEAQYTSADYAETIYRKLGINTTARLRRSDGRPVDFTDGGRPIRDVF